jgi:hypothetical protein
MQMNPKRRRVVSSDDDFNELSFASELNTNLKLAGDSVCPNYPKFSKQQRLADIPDGPFLLILSFYYDTEDSLQAIKLAFQIFGFMSKTMREKVISLAQAAPVKLSKSFLVSPMDCKDVEMVCKLRLKLDSLLFEFDDQVYKSVFTHVLNSCNIQAMHNISFNIHPTKCDLSLLQVSDQIGIPCDRNHRAILLSNMAFQEHVARILKQKQCTPRRLEIRFKIEESLYRPLLSNLSTNLEELKLEGWCSLPNPETYSTARSLSCLEEDLGYFPKLKIVSFCWPRMRRDMLIELKSSSIVSLSVSGGLNIQNLRCSSLKTLILVLNTGSVDLRIVRQCRSSLRDLTLQIDSPSANASLYDNISSLIEKLPSLKKFTLITRCSQDLVIRSSSLEELDLICAENMTLKQCICSDLKVVHSSKG